MEKVIAVFGSARPTPGSADYEQARSVGKMLAEAGYAVATGGYCGAMEGASQGAAEAGGRAIGVLCDQIEQFRPEGANQWVTETIRYPTYRERMDHLVVNNAGIIALPGGIGTLGELTLAWGLAQIGEIPARPIAALGSIWREVIEGFAVPPYVSTVHLEMIRLVETPAQAVAHIINGS